MCPEGINASDKMLDNSHIQTVDAPKAIAAIRFPIAYYDLVLPATQKFKVDPLLIFSMMRQESLFEGNATASAAAQGLLQIIPDTCAYILPYLTLPNCPNSESYNAYIKLAFRFYLLPVSIDTFH